MSISQRIAEYKPARIGGACRTCELLRTLPKAEAKALQDALDNPKFSNNGLSKILKSEGYSIADTTVGRHRRKECKQ